MADKIEDDIKRFVRQTQELVQRRLPVAVGRLAKSHFQENFVKGGFVNNGINPWKPAQRLSSGGTDADSQYPTLLSSRKHLYSSIGYTPGMAKVTIFNDVIYAQIHNEGGTIPVKVTPKMRRFAWAKYYQLAGESKSPGKGKKRGKQGKSESNIPEEALKWKGLALTKKTELSINIPKRQFMGDSAELDVKIQNYIEKEILKILNS